MKSYNKLSVDTQLRLKHLLVERMDESISRNCGLSPELLGIPDVAHAAISKGWGPGLQGFSSVLKTSPWGKDSAFLLSVANATLKNRDGYFWECCTKGLLHDEDVLSKVLAVLQGGSVPDRLRNDFDVRCASVLDLSSCGCADVLEYRTDLAREAR